MKNSMQELIDRLANLSGHRARPTYSDGICPFQLITTVSRKDEEARAVSMRYVPDDVRAVWSEFDELKLFEDDKHGQWGLEIFNESEARLATEELIKTRANDFSSGDLVVGEFLGDSDLLIVRTNPSELDYGTVLVALPLDTRSEWYRPATTLAKFMAKYLDVEGEKFWELNT